MKSTLGLLEKQAQLYPKRMTPEEWEKYTKQVEADMGSNAMTALDYGALSTIVGAPALAVQQFFADDDDGGGSKVVPEQST